nr:hypothetical protein CFP56_24093 [Quercus suber]
MKSSLHLMWFDDQTRRNPSIRNQCAPVDNACGWKYCTKRWGDVVRDDTMHRNGLGHCTPTLPAAFLWTLATLRQEKRSKVSYGSDNEKPRSAHLPRTEGLLALKNLARSWVRAPPCTLL